MTEEQLNDEQAIDGMLSRAFWMGVRIPTILRDIERGHRGTITARSVRAHAQILEGAVALLRRIAKGESTMRSRPEIPSGLDRETKRLLKETDLMLREGDREDQKVAQRLIASIDRKNPQMAMRSKKTP